MTHFAQYNSMKNYTIVQQIYKYIILICNSTLSINYSFYKNVMKCILSNEQGSFCELQEPIKVGEVLSLCVHMHDQRISNYTLILGFAPSLFLGEKQDFVQLTFDLMKQDWIWSEKKVKNNLFFPEKQTNIQRKKETNKQT